VETFFHLLAYHSLRVPKETLLRREILSPDLYGYAYSVLSIYFVVQYRIDCREDYARIIISVM